MQMKDTPLYILYTRLLPARCSHVNTPRPARLCSAFSCGGPGSRGPRSPSPSAPVSPPHVALQPGLFVAPDCLQPALAPLQPCVGRAGRLRSHPALQRDRALAVLGWGGPLGPQDSGPQISSRGLRAYRFPPCPSTRLLAQPPAVTVPCFCARLDPAPILPCPGQRPPATLRTLLGQRLQAAAPEAQAPCRGGGGV